MITQLVKIRLSSLVSGLSSVKGKGGSAKPSVARVVLFAVLFIYVIAVFLGLSILMAISFGKALIPLGAGWLYFALFGLASFCVVFIFSIFETKSELFDCKDNELLLSMPIKERDIVLSRIVTVLVYNYAATLVVMAPAVVVYSVLAKDFVGTLGGALSILIIPLPATALASAVGYLVAFITKKIKNGTAVTVLASLAFLALYFWGYSALMSQTEDILENPLLLMNSLGGVGILGVIGRAVMLSVPEFLVFLASSLLISYLAYYLICINYISIISDNRGARRVAYKRERLEERSLIVALTVKELKRFISSSVYLLNAGLGVLFRVIVGVLALFKGRDVIEILDMLILEIPGLDKTGAIALLVSCAVIMLSSMDMISACAVSLEGKNLWITKSMPISAADSLISKTLAHSVVCLPATLISSVLILIGVGAPISAVPFAIITPLIATLVFAVFGTVINVAFPKFDFENDAQPVKQSLATFIVMFSQMLYSFGIFIGGIYLALKIGAMLTAGLVLLLNVLMLLTLVIILWKLSIPRFANI